MNRYVSLITANRSVLGISCFEGVVVGVAIPGLPARENSLLHALCLELPHAAAGLRGL